MENKFWKESWRDEINCESDDDHAITEKAIAKWLRDNEPGCNSQAIDIEELADLKARTMTGIPTGVEMPPPLLHRL